jgi:hypothetical protein
VLYLGELNDSQHEAWCRVIEAFDEDGKSRRQIALLALSASLYEILQILGLTLFEKTAVNQLFDDGPLQKALIQNDNQLKLFN